MKNKLLIFTVLLLTLCSCDTNTEPGDSGPSTITIDGKIMSIKTGDEICVNHWNREEPEYTYNNKSLKSMPVMFNGITIGSDFEDVVAVFNLKSGYAGVDREIATPEEDGTTDIVTEEYQDGSFFEQEDVLDACINIAYKKVGDQWIMVSYDDIKSENYDILYNLDFVGSSLADDASVGEKQLICFNVIAE